MNIRNKLILCKKLGYNCMDLFITNLKMEIIL